MRVLLDACVWSGARQTIESAGHEVVWVGDWNEDPGDEQIIDRAHQEGRVLVTLDKDFGELAVVRGVAHSGIVRLVGLRAVAQGAAAAAALGRYADELSGGAIVTVEPTRVRVRPGGSGE